MAGPRTRGEAKRRRHAAPAAAATGPGQVERLYEALDSGVLWFLGVQDLVRLLGTCSLLRNDRNLSVVALSNTAAGVHLMQHCASDWMDVSLQEQQEGVVSAAERVAASFFWSECTEHRHLARNHELNRRLLEDTTRLDYARGQGAQLLSLIGQMEKRHMLLFSGVSAANPFGEFCRARPVILPLPKRPSAALTAPWTLGDARVALNSLWDRFGDDFAGSTAEYVHVSELGVHWENIATSKRDGKEKCQFCDVATEAIREYRSEARALQDEFARALRTKQKAWRAEGLDDDEIHERRSELKAEMFPEDSYPDANAADSIADDILAHICEHDRFPMDPFDGMASGLERKNDDIFNALSQECKALCQTLYKPFKQMLATNSAVCGQRIHRAWMDTGEGDGLVRRELIAAVSASGFLVGAYVMRAIQD
ncbi:hypothetical protein BBJ28_00005030 [Nothophytophthora sp. Chile5]|nr:hypothetical protein BBJ28_00005030 [Nothophytophthora sp. Chile5]